MRLREYIDLVEGAAHPAGYIVLNKVTVEGQDYWGAVFFKRKPSLQGVEHADKVLVDTVSRAGKSRETALKAALKNAPGAQVIEVDR